MIVFFCQIAPEKTNTFYIVPKVSTCKREVGSLVQDIGGPKFQPGFSQTFPDFWSRKKILGLSLQSVLKQVSWDKLFGQMED